MYSLVQRKELNKWVDNWDKYLAAESKSVSVTVSHHQAVKRSFGIGHHPQMENELAAFIKNLRSM